MLTVPGGTVLLIDESYNANPASMRAAIALLGQAAVGDRGRRIAVLGDMLELGPSGTELHRAIAEVVDDARYRSCLLFWTAHAFVAGRPSSRVRGGYADTAEGLRLLCWTPSGRRRGHGEGLARFRKMGPIVRALERKFPRQAALAQAPAQGVILRVRLNVLLADRTVR